MTTAREIRESKDDLWRLERIHSNGGQEMYIFGRDQTILAHDFLDPRSVDGLLHLVKETVRQLGPPARIATDASIEFQTIRFCELLWDHGIEHVVELPSHYRRTVQ
jgi:hypothetical protein